jgi:hypothetical protein
VLFCLSVCLTINLKQSKNSYKAALQTNTIEGLSQEEIASSNVPGNFVEGNAPSSPPKKEKPWKKTI